MKNHILEYSIFSKHIFAFFLSSVLFLPLYARKKDVENNIYYREWQPLNSVRNKADSPLGRVFFIPRSHDFFVSKISDTNYTPQKKALNTLSVSLFNNSKEARKNRKRFLVLDFAFRYSPVNPTREMLEEYAPSLPIFGWSKNFGGISNQIDLDAVWLENSQNLEIANANGLSHRLKTEQIYCRDNRFLKKSFYFYEVNYCRIIINQKDMYGYHSINLNGYKTIFKFDSELKKISLPEINSFALASNIESLFLDISPIKIQHYESEKELKNLPALNQTPYKYSDFLNITKKQRSRIDKTEFEYAQGMNFLYGSDLDWKKGVQLLERAARKDHALAKFQLGCAYYRGIGCKKDLKLAKKYLNEAVNMKVYGAERVLGALLYEENFPFTYDKREKYPFKIIKTKEGYDIAKKDSYPNSAQEIIGNDKWMKLCYSLLDPDLNKQKNILDQLCKEQYAPALFFRALKQFGDVQYRNDKTHVKQMLSDFQKGSLLGNDYCTIFYLRAQLLLDSKYDVNMLSMSEMMQSVHNPTFHFLYYAIRTKNLPYLRDFVTGNYNKIIELKPQNANEYFIRAIATLHTFLFSQSDTNPLFFIFGLEGRLNPYSLTMPISEKQQKGIDIAFNDLQIAADAGIPEAQYVLGAWLLEKRSKRHNPNQGKKYLTLSSKKYLPSVIKMADLSLMASDYDNAKKYLLLAGNPNSPVILDLSAKLQLRLAPNRLQTLQLLEKAANVGSLDSILFLSDYFMTRDKISIAQKYQKKYFVTDSLYSSQESNLSSWPFAFCIIKPLIGTNNLPLNLDSKGMTQDEGVKVYHTY